MNTKNFNNLAGSNPHLVGKTGKSTRAAASVKRSNYTELKYKKEGTRYNELNVLGLHALIFCCSLQESCFHLLILLLNLLIIY